MALKSPKSITVKDRDGNEKEFILSRLPVWDMREVAFKYVPSAIPKVGDYPISEAMGLKLLAYVGVPREGMEPLMLTTRALVENHCDFVQAIMLEGLQFEHNVGFFENGAISRLFQRFAPPIAKSISSMWTGLLEQLSRAVKQHYTN